MVQRGARDAERPVPPVRIGASIALHSASPYAAAALPSPQGSPFGARCAFGGLGGLFSPQAEPAVVAQELANRSELSGVERCGPENLDPRWKDDVRLMGVAGSLTVSSRNIGSGGGE